MGFYSLVIKRMTGRYPTVFITRKIFFYGVLTILPAFFFIRCNRILMCFCNRSYCPISCSWQSWLLWSAIFFGMWFETAGNDAGFQLYLFESVGDDGGFGAHSPRTNHMDYVNGGGLHHIRGLSGGKEVGSFHLLSAGKLRTNIDIVYPRTSGFVSALCDLCLYCLDRYIHWLRDFLVCQILRAALQKYLTTFSGSDRIASWIKLFSSSVSSESVMLTCGVSCPLMSSSEIVAFLSRIAFRHLFWQPEKISFESKPDFKFFSVFPYGRKDVTCYIFRFLCIS